MRIPAQLIERGNLGIVGAEIEQEIACRAMVLTDRGGSKSGAERIYRTLEQVSQRMLKGSTSREVHEEITGTGRMCWATARVYC